ncbi:unnamed protein product [Rodentolepis nana]|uniref:Protein kinase domain-containing protein n=1 Tax=Rodentolepis nana TaxID=102285 RepID=A0A0R3TYX7_RODNA|nr:unnamed protein product [Rodentolepis nana]
MATYFPRLLPTRSAADPFQIPLHLMSHPLSTGTCVGPYRMERLLGRGNFAVVKLATHTQLNVPVAVKIINKELVGGQNLAKMARELEAMKMCYRHPNVVRFFAHAFTEKEARELFWQVVCAIDYCHKLGVVHRDLKAENLLIDADFKIKVADFGFCNFFTPNNLLTTHCGSPQYAAPELFKGESYDGPLVDVWVCCP